MERGTEVGRKRSGHRRFFEHPLSEPIFICLLSFRVRKRERVTENKGDKFRRKKNMEIQSGGEKMRNASGQQGENQRQ